LETDTNGLIESKYDYRDERGQVLYQKCRNVPKGFSQRRPDGKGRWINNLKGVRRVLYRLPDLIAADPDMPVYIVEGEKDVETLRKLGRIATCNDDGAGKGKWKPEYNEYFRGRQVVLIPDNDAVGREHMEQIAKGLHGIATKIKIVHLTDLQEGGDISDWVAHGHTAVELFNLVMRSPKWTPDDADVYRTFPTNLLPSPIREYIRAAARSIGCDESYVALPLLTALAAAIGNTRRILLKADWTEPSVLWTVIIGDSGTLKSPAIDFGVHFLVARQDVAFAAFEKARADYKRLSVAHDVKLKDWQKRHAAKAEHDWSDLIPLAPEEPVCERLVCSDTTVEALARLLHHNPRGLLTYTDELSGWIAGFDAYKSTSGGDEAHWLAMHRAGSLTVDRKSGQQQVMHSPRAAVSVTGGIQPQVLEEVLNQRNFDTGLAARLLFASPPKRRRQWTDEVIPDDVRERVAQVFDKLLALEFATGGSLNCSPIDLPLSPDGLKAYVRFFNEHAAEQHALQGDVAAAWSKLEGYAARLSLIVHLVRQVAGDNSLKSSDLIDATSINVGIALSRWFGHEATRVYRLVGDEDEADQAHEHAELLTAIRRRGGRLTARDLMQTRRRYRDSMEHAEAALQGLVTLGLGHWEVVETPGRDRREFVLQSDGNGNGG